MLTLTLEQLCQATICTAPVIVGLLYLNQGPLSQQSIYMERIHHAEPHLTPGPQLSFTTAVVTSGNAQSVGQKKRKDMGKEK